jgi:hypothetical protein
MIVISSVANLAAETRETMTISFDPIYHSATPGSSAWSMVTSNMQIHLFVPFGRYVPRMIMTRLRARLADTYMFVQQTGWLLPMNDNEFIGTVPLPLYIRGGDDGLTQAYQQHILFDRLYHDFGDDTPDPVASDALIDPISQSSQFQVDLFAATPFASVDIGAWSSVLWSRR